MRLPVLTQQDRHDAQTMSSRREGHRFEIQLGHLCNNRCVFCSSGQLTEMKLARSIQLDPVLQALEQARAEGANHLTFLGGEPTIHKSFVPALEHASKLGFEHIVIFTNGVMFPHPGFIEKVVNLGRFEWRISIQGGNEQAHVAVTKREDSFQRIVHGLRELQQRGQRITVNLCVNALSYTSLPDYVPLVREFGIVQLHVDVVRPASVGQRTEEDMRAMMCRHSDVASFLRPMLEGFDAWDPTFDVNVGNLPYCVLPEWFDKVHHGGEHTITVASDAVSLEAPRDKYDWHASLRNQVPACASCAFARECSGVFPEYVELHGDAEFQPISAAERERVEAIAEQRTQRAMALRKSRQRVHAIVDGLKRFVTRAQWSVGDIVANGDASRVPVLTDRGVVQVVFMHRVQHERVQLDVDFEPAQSMREDDAVARVGQLIDWLREVQRPVRRATTLQP